MLIEHMAQGLSFESFAAVIKVNRDTLYEWEKIYPEFSDTKKEALEQCLLFWEKLGIDNIIKKKDSEWQGDSGWSKDRSLDATAWIFNMKNRFKWRDKQPDENDTLNVNISLADEIAKARKRLNDK